MRSVRDGLKHLLLGRTNFPQQFTLGLQEPQDLVDVLLCGLGEPLNVTQTHMMACGAPLTICVGLSPALAERVHGARLTLKFSDRGLGSTLGEISLRHVSTITAGEQRLCMFHVADYANYCLPRLRLWAHYLQYARSFRPDQNPDVPITRREARAMIIFYLCPRPVVLVTVEVGESRNMFPMNLMGYVGDGYFAFALNSHRCVAPLVDRARRVVLSTVPLQEAATAVSLRSNHRKASIPWSDLPFPLIRPDRITMPVPAFALDAREMQVEAAYPLGSHTLFLAKTVNSERFARGSHFFSAHGLYQAWRQRTPPRASTGETDVPPYLKPFNP